jgi:hypothetical protein
MDVDVAKPAVEWTEDDVRGTARAVGVWWGLVAEGAAPLPHALEGAAERAVALAAELQSDRPFAERAARADTLVALLSAAGRAVVAAGHGPPDPAAGAGVVEGVFASGGGVPKAPVTQASVGWRGLDGDRQAARKHHGRVWQALCLWSADVVDALAAEGHPVFPGAAGENVSVRGVDWAALRPGVRLRLGTVLAEVTVPALPCAKNARWFVDGDFARMHHERDRAVTRWYALVIEPGTVAAGDPVRVEPA